MASERRLIDVRVDPDRAVPVLLGTGLVLCFLSLVGAALRARVERDVPGLRAAIALTDVAQPGSVPTWFQSLLLMLIASVLWTVADDARARTDRWARHWRVLAVGFAVLSADELVEFHERVVTAVGEHTAGRIPEDLTWAMIVIPLVILAGIAFQGFLRGIPRATSLGLLLGAGLCFGGSVLLDLVGLTLYSAVGQDSVLLAVQAVTEEAMEIVGMTTLLVAVAREQGPGQVTAPDDGRLTSAPKLIELSLDATTAPYPALPAFPVHPGDPATDRPASPGRRARRSEGRRPG